jgi:hypothetical protein
MLTSSIGFVTMDNLESKTFGKYRSREHVVTRDYSLLPEFNDQENLKKCKFPNNQCVLLCTFTLTLTHHRHSTGDCVVAHGLGHTLPAAHT